MLGVPYELSCRRAASAAPAAALAVAAALAASAQAAPPTGLVSGLLSQTLRGAEQLGSVPDSSRQGLTLVLKSRDGTGLHRFLVDPKHPALSPATFAKRFGPAPQAVERVRRWASSAGLDVQSVSANRSVVRLSAPADRVERALDVSLRRFSLSSLGSYVAATGRPVLPASVRQVTASVLGLNGAARLQLPQHTAAADGGESTYGPKELTALYGGQDAPTGQGQDLSIITAGKVQQPQADLAQFEEANGLPKVTWDRRQVGAASEDTSGDVEWDLDSQYATGLAPGVKTLHVYVGPSLADEDILATVNQWVSDRASSQASFSAGECEELAALSGFQAGLDTILAQAAAQGQTLFTSSGDTGSQCPLPVVSMNGLPVGLPGTDFPASSPNAIGVGGTTVQGAGPQETAWIGSGGGLSLTEQTPSWQQDAGGSALGVRRSVPDVALDADPASGYRVIVAGKEQTIGGTSASAPAWQGIWARAQSAHGGTLGFAGPSLYRVPGSVFNDITLGTNTLFPATPGYDLVTGRGTPKIGALVAAAG